MHIELLDGAFDRYADHSNGFCLACVVCILKSCWVRIDVTPENSRFFWTSVQAVTHAVAMHYVDGLIFGRGRRVAKQLVQRLWCIWLLQVPILRSVNVHAACAVAIADK